MVEVQDFRRMGEALGDACAVLRSNAASAGLAAEVPTCPGWNMGDLVAHVGMVHRWATAKLARERGFSNFVAIADAHAAPDLLDWFDEGMVDLLNAFAAAPPDLEIRFFLPDAPPPRDAWLRRQVHETTIHAADAMGARLGRAPRDEELWVAPWLAADGVDEVLTGFVQRGGMLTSRTPRRTLLTATDVERRWLLEVGPDGTTTSRVDEPVGADVTADGTARELYLAVWNRGSGATASEETWWPTWREHVRVAWA